MRSSERDVLLMLLAVCAGSADGWSYFGLGHSFVANMTGNTVLVGLAVFQVNGDVVHPLISLVCYAGGVALATFLIRRVPEGAIWSRKVSAVLLFEGILMAGAAGEWFAMHGQAFSTRTSPVPPNLDPLLGVVALAIGIQSGLMLRLKVPGIVTTYITGTSTNLASGLVRLTTRKTRLPRQEKVEFEARLLLQAGILAAYLFSAILTGWLFRYHPSGVGGLSASSLLAVAIYGLVRG